MSRRHRDPVRVRSHRRRPALEALEERTLLATMLWDNPSGGDWDIATNWVNQANPLDNHVPRSSDDAQINTAGITVTHSTTSIDSVHSLSSSANLTISAGSLSVINALTITQANKIITFHTPAAY